MSLQYLKYESRKKQPFPRIEKKMCKNYTDISIKGPFKTTGEEKTIKQTPHEIEKYKGQLQQKMKILKIAGSRADFLDFV